MKFEFRAEIKEILNPTKATMFKNCKVGDVLKLTLPIKPAGRGCRSSYVNYIVITNERTLEKTKKSFNQIGYLFDNFVFEELEG